MSAYTKRFDCDEFLGLISDAERLYPDEGGLIKKAYVLRELRNDLDGMAYERYLPIIDPMIDMLKEIARDRNVVFSVLLKQDKKRSWLSRLFFCCC